MLQDPLFCEVVVWIILAIGVLAGIGGLLVKSGSSYNYAREKGKCERKPRRDRDDDARPHGRSCGRSVHRG